MVGIIHRREQIKIPESFDPLIYFDSKDTCTEADFITILEHGCYDSRLIGKYVTLSNSVDYNGGKWVIADVNHDSENTGQTNCYDLISENCFYMNPSYYTFRGWRNSYNEVRDYLNYRFYDGFSADFKARVLNLKYKCEGSWYNDDKIIVPSYKEVKGGNNSYQKNDGVAYPIFANNASRMKKITATASNFSNWLLRSLYARTNYNNYLWYASLDGGISYSNNTSATWYIASLMRVS